MELEIDAAHPEALAFQPLDEMPADEAAGTAHQSLLHDMLSRSDATASSPPMAKLAI